MKLKIIKYHIHIWGLTLAEVSFFLQSDQWLNAEQFSGHSFNSSDFSRHPWSPKFPFLQDLTLRSMRLPIGSHSDQSVKIGQTVALQGLVSKASPSQPKFSGSHLRWRSRVQDAGAILQLPQAVQSEHEFFTHSRLSRRFSVKHAAWGRIWALFEQIRSREASPAPQVTEHWDQGDHSDNFPHKVSHILRSIFSVQFFRWVHIQIFMVWFWRFF